MPHLSAGHHGQGHSYGETSSQSLLQVLAHRQKWIFGQFRKDVDSFVSSRRTGLTVVDWEEVEEEEVEEPEDFGRGNFSMVLEMLLPGAAGARSASLFFRGFCCLT